MDPQPTEPASAPAAAPSWTPTVGLILKHKTIKQSIEILGTMTIPGLPPFWEVNEVGVYGDPPPWMVVEPCLIEQYEPRQ